MSKRKRYINRYILIFINNLAKTINSYLNEQNIATYMTSNIMKL